jgi:hypothetical protein
VTSAQFDLRGDGSPGPDGGFTPLRWPLRPGVTATVHADVGWWLAPLAGVPDAAVDLVRIAGGAYIADRLTRRGTGFSREIGLTVAVTDPCRWAGSLVNDVSGLLHLLTGDQWYLTLAADSCSYEETLRLPSLDKTPGSLLSGGLDSFLGALYLLPQEPAMRFVGHADAATSIRAAQHRIGTWLSQAYSPVPSYTRLALRQAREKQEPSSRSRSLMFMALGAAAVASSSGTSLYVPENGYTSLNIPLHPNRAGALSTRSTHPETLRRVNDVLARVDLGVTVINPFAEMTKGEAMRAVASMSLPAGWLDAAAATVSCSKLDGGRLPGGNPNLNCGLCVPCLVRRATFIAAGLHDGTHYLVDALTGNSLDMLVTRRKSDLDAVRYAIASGVDDDAIDSGTWPPDYDLDAAADLVRRGLAELAVVPLP